VFSGPAAREPRPWRLDTLDGSSGLGRTGRATSRAVQNPGRGRRHQARLKHAVDLARRAQLHRTGLDMACDKHDAYERGCGGCQQRKRHRRIREQLEQPEYRPSRERPQVLDRRLAKAAPAGDRPRQRSLPGARPALPGGRDDRSSPAAFLAASGVVLERRELGGGLLGVQRARGRREGGKPRQPADVRAPRAGDRGSAGGDQTSSSPASPGTRTDSPRRRPRQRSPASPRNLM
jgi:hypothetical protein